MVGSVYNLPCSGMDPRVKPEDDEVDMMTAITDARD